MTDQLLNDVASIEHDGQKILYPDRLHPYLGAFLDPDVLDEKLKELAKPFEAHQIGKLPKITCSDCSNTKPAKVCSKHKKIDCEGCGNWITERHLHLDYVGHAMVTHRLLSVDPLWSWEPMGVAQDGCPVVVVGKNEAELWIRLTVCGITRPGVGTCKVEGFERSKQLIGDAIRNAAMRFGVALDLWSKEDFEQGDAAPQYEDRGNRNSGSGSGSGRSSTKRAAPKTAPPVGVIDPDDVRALLLAMDDVADETRRKHVKVDFVKRFAKPPEVGADDLHDAWVWLAEQMEVSDHPHEPSDPPEVCVLCGTLPRAPWHTPKRAPESPVDDSGVQTPAATPESPSPVESGADPDAVAPRSEPLTAEWVAGAAKSGLVNALHELGAPTDGTVAELRERLSALIAPL